MRRAALVLLLSFLLASCSWYGGESAHTLEKHRETWETLDLANYQFTFDSGCFCDQGPVPARIVVRADTLHAVLDLETKDTLRARGSKRPVWKERPKQYPTIDRLFEIVGGELSTLYYGRPDSIHVEYNEAYGYPEHIYIDPRARMTEDETTVTVDDLAANRDDRQ